MVVCRNKHKKLYNISNNCIQLGQEPEDDFEDLDTEEASEEIEELKYMLEERGGRPEAK